MITWANDWASALPCCKEEAVDGCARWLCRIGTVFWDRKESCLNSRGPSLQSMPEVCLAALHRSGVVQASIPKVTARLSPSCRRFTRNELPWKRSWSSYVPSPSCDLPHHRAVARAEHASRQPCKERSVAWLGRASAEAVVVGRTSLSGLLSPRCARLPLQVKKVQKTNIWLPVISERGIASPSFLPFPSLMCKCSLSLKQITWEYFIYVKNSWFIRVLAAPPAPIVKRYSIPEFLLKFKTHPLRWASGCYWFR